MTANLVRCVRNIFKMFYLMESNLNVVFSLFYFFPSGFVFLRLLCPAILNPRMFNIIAGKCLLEAVFLS